MAWTRGRPSSNRRESGGDAMTLELATEGPCKGHLCDNCPTCQRGRCCRRDNPNYRLPELGEWDGPIYGELGVLNDDGEKVECHCCGEWFKMIGGIHLLRAHNLTAPEYRAIFGFSQTRGLASQKLRDMWSAHMHRRIDEGKVRFHNEGGF